MVTIETTATHKPGPEPIEHALELLGRPKAGAVYVGDAVSDLQAARAAGVAAVGVTWGAFSYDGPRRRRARCDRDDAGRARCASSRPMADDAAQDPARARGVAARRARRAICGSTTSSTSPRSRTPSTTRSTASCVELEDAAPRAAHAPDSPTQRVGARPAEGFAPAEHLLPMLSLANARDREALAAWDARARKLLAQRGLDEDIAYVTEPKIDGLAISLVYRDGVLARGATRGDGLDRRGRHGQPAHDRRRCRKRLPRRRPAGADRGARRDLPAARGLRAAQRGAPRGRAERAHEPAQLGRGLAAAEGSARHRLAPARAAHLRASARSRASSSTRTGACSSGCGEHGFPVNPISRRHETFESMAEACEGLVELRARARLRHRRLRRQDRPPRPAGGARVGRARPALGDRVQVPAHDRDHAAARHRPQRGADRRAQPVRGARAGRRRRRDRAHGDAPQRGRHQAQGRAHRRSRDRAARRRRDPAGRRAGARAPRRQRARVPHARPLPGLRRRDRARPRARPCTAASTRTARAAGSRACATSSRAARWTSTAWARS